MAESQLRYIGPRPRGGNDLARYQDIEDARGNLLGHSQILELATEQMNQRNMIQTADFDALRAQFSLKSELANVLNSYIPKSDYGVTTVQLDETGKIPRDIYESKLETYPANVYSKNTPARGINSGDDDVISTITIPSQPHEFYALPFSTFYYGRAAYLNPTRVFIEGPSGEMLGRGESIQSKNESASIIGLTVTPVKSNPLPPGSPHTIGFHVYAGQGSVWNTELKANPWCVICIPKGA